MLTLRNESATPAMMIRLCLKADDGMRVLPVDYTDNYFHLMPGEERTVRVKWNRDDTRRQTPFIELTGFNVKQHTLRENKKKEIRSEEPYLLFFISGRQPQQSDCP